MSGWVGQCRTEMGRQAYTYDVSSVPRKAVRVRSWPCHNVRCWDGKVAACCQSCYEDLRRAQPSLPHVRSCFRVSLLPLVSPSGSLSCYHSVCLLENTRGSSTPVRRSHLRAPKCPLQQPAVVPCSREIIGSRLDDFVLVEGTYEGLCRYHEGKTPLLRHHRRRKVTCQSRLDSLHLGSCHPNARFCLLHHCSVA